MKLSEEYDGIAICSGSSTDPGFPKTAIEALRLIEKINPRWYRRTKKYISKIIQDAASFDYYDYESKTFHVHTVSKIEDVAASVIFAASRGYLWERGFKAKPTDERFKRVCMNQAYRFLLRFSQIRTDLSMEQKNQEIASLRKRCEQYFYSKQQAEPRLLDRLLDVGNKAEGCKKNIPGFLKFLIFLSGFSFLSCLLAFSISNRQVLQKNVEWRQTLINRGENVWNGKVVKWSEKSEFRKKSELATLEREKALLQNFTKVRFWNLVEILGNGLLFLGLLRLFRWVRFYYIFWAVFYCVGYYLLNLKAYQAFQFLFFSLLSSSSPAASFFFTANILSCIYTAFYLNSSKIRSLYR